MDVNEFLEGSTLTGRQAALIFFAFLLLVITAGILLILFSDLFQGIV
ncbi:hypothetical protein SAMN04487967_0760 [Natronorubrum sediminis]|uniref:Uncharacterized protein n=1 Tax=Natronorubrum sediminis TaxID=640943 RepID=A0A1H6FN54_9EURY|nr:hypothetical protein [Natronorubrum sediminis]SEH12331.1 hypothetical protein SAMN04487967_0760 [Natronorubrum sediminis]